MGTAHCDRLVITFREFPRKNNFFEKKLAIRYNRGNEFGRAFRDHEGGWFPTQVALLSIYETVSRRNGEGRELKC